MIFFSYTMINWENINGTIWGNFTQFKFCKISWNAFYTKLIPRYVITHLKLENLCFIYVQMTLIVIVVYIQRNFVFPLVKLILNFLSTVPMILLMILVRPSPNTKKIIILVIRMIRWISSTPTVIKVLANPLSKFHNPAPLNATLPHYYPCK